jgi:hypothetical protein
MVNMLEYTATTVLKYLINKIATGNSNGLAPQATTNRFLVEVQFHSFLTVGFTPGGIRHPHPFE